MKRGTRTAGEIARLALLREEFPGGCWAAEYRFCSERRWRFDFASPVWLIAIEIEGGSRQGGRHNRHAGFVADMEKYNRATVLGWRLLRFIPRDFDNGAAIPLVSELLEDQDK